MKSRNMLIACLPSSKILIQMHQLMRASCNPPVAPQGSVRFHCRSGFWASNVDLGKSGKPLIPRLQCDNEKP